MAVPSATVLLEAVTAYLAEIEPELTGRAAFHAKVAANVLAVVARELDQQPALAEAAAFARLLGPGATAAQVCERLRDGRLTIATPGVLDALLAATTARLAVDNPRYSTFRRLTGTADAATPTPALR